MASAPGQLVDSARSDLHVKLYFERHIESYAELHIRLYTNTIHIMSRASYGSPRVWSELRLGDGVRCSRKRVERLMRLAGLQGLHRRKFRGCTRRNPDATPSQDLVNRQFSVEGPDRLWVSDITEHATAEGKVYVAVVLDAVALTLNTRPRKTLGWKTPAEALDELLRSA